MTNKQETNPFINCITFAICNAQVLNHMSPIEENHTAHIAMVYSITVMPKCSLIREYINKVPSGHTTAGVDTMIGKEMHKIFNIPNFRIYDYSTGETFAYE